MTTADGTIKIGFSKSTGNLKSHIRWFEKLIGEDFNASIKKSFQKKKNIKTLQSVARQIIEDVVYIPEPDDQIYERTESQLRSFVAAVSGGGIAGISVYSDLSSTAGRTNQWNSSGSPLAVGGASKGKFSYAGFFEAPFSNVSFLEPDRKPYRPYFALMVKAVSGHATHEAAEAILVAIKKGKPKLVEM